MLLASYSWLCHAPFDPYPLKLELNQFFFLTVTLTPLRYDRGRKSERVINLSHVKKAAAQVILLAAGAAMLCFGVWRGEAATVLSKAIKLCLECVGIG